MNIKEIIKDNAQPTSLKRGKAIFNNDGILDFTSMDNNHYDAKVAGSGRKSYQLHFSVSDQNHLTSFCSCPYDWGGICKHLVAALFYLDVHIGQSTIPLSVKDKEAVKRNTSTPYKVLISDLDNLHDLAGSSIYNQAYYKTNQVNEISICEDKMIVQIASDRYYGEYTTIHIQPDKKHLHISSDSSKKVAGLSVYELTALIYLKRSEMTYLFDVFDEQKLNEMILQKAKQYGIEDISTAHEYFEVNINGNGEVIHLKNEHQNLLPLSTYRNDFNDFAKKITGGENNREDVLLAHSAKRKEKNPIVIRFALQTDSMFNDNTIISLLPFVGKIKPDGSFYKTNLQPLSNLNHWNHSHPELTDQDRELISFSEKFGKDTFSDGLRTTYNKLNDSQKQLFVLEQNLKVLRNLFPKLPKDTFLLNQENNYYYNYRMDAGDLQPITICHETPLPILEINTKDGFVIITPKLKFSTGSYKWGSKKIKFLNEIFGTLDHKAFLMGSAETAIVVHSTFSEFSSFKVMETDFHDIFNDMIRPLSKYMTLDIKQLPVEINEEVNMSNLTSKKVYLKELDQFILIKPIVEYGQEAVNILEDQPTVRITDNTVVHLNRNLEEEHNFLEIIQKCHPDFNKKQNQDFFHLHLDDFVQDYWFLNFSEKLKNEGISVYGFNDFKKFQYSPHQPSINVKVGSGEDWFDVDIEVLVGDTRIGLKDLKKALASKDKYIKLGDGKLAVLPSEWIEKLQRYLRMGKIEKEGVKISKLRFNAIDELFEGIDNDEVLQEIAEKRRKLQEFSSLTKVSLPKVSAKLRDYQKEGYRWLHFLHEFSWGGILADDMGLGKTLQIITFLRFLKSNKVKNNLIIVPTTLLFNWKVELEKFCPSLSFYIHHGTDRDKAKIDWEKYDLIITTYGLIISDIKLFSKQKYGYVILDESQAIKNPASKRFKAVNVLNATNRLALTGTPIENNTFDLYAQMSFVNPGLFVSAEGFRKQYAIPIDKNGDQNAASELNKTIHPFILRRTKEMVATELPPKIEDVIYCNMGTAQRKVYDAYRNEYRNNIQNLIEEDGLGKSKLHVLQALTKLRQICNSPALLNGEESYDDESVKIKELIRHIQEKTGNHKLLIFSQFVKMLHLIKNELEKLEINYSYLDGKTTQKNRKQAVDDFQDNENIRVFLISLKAGGTGINLTAADYVYIVDPWWNPAVENQAIDRCYRIGQDKKVIAYRMICKDTIEEKIMKYKNKKQVVADSIIQTDEHVMKQISKDDIMELFG